MVNGKKEFFIGSQIPTLTADEHSGKSSPSVIDIGNNFLGTHKAENYSGILANLLNSYKVKKCNLSLKINFLDSHREFSECIGTISVEYGKSCHQQISRAHKRHQGKLF